MASPQAGFETRLKIIDCGNKMPLPSHGMESSMVEEIDQKTGEVMWAVFVGGDVRGRARAYAASRQLPHVARPLALEVGKKVL